VLATGDFNNDFLLEAHEINNVSSYGLLSPEFKTLKLIPLSLAHSLLSASVDPLRSCLERVIFSLFQLVLILALTPTLSHTMEREYKVLSTGGRGF
jgi:hypothetical protein